MKKLIFILILSSVIAIAFTQEKVSISGKIISSEGEAIPFASIIIQNTYLGTSADLEGNYKISKIPLGIYQIEATAIGFKNSIEKIDLTKDQVIDFILEPSIIMADEVIIKAIRAQNNNPIAHENINQAEIESGNIAADIPYQLQFTPSLVATSENGTGIGYTSFRIRGTDINRINVTINGIPLNDAESQGVFFVDLPDFSASVDNIQIQRGIGTSSNGAAAFGATVDFKTLDLNVDPYVNVSTAFGSFNTKKASISVGSGMIKDKFSFDMRYSKLKSDGYIKRGFSNHNSLYLSGSYYSEKNIVKLIAILGEEHTGITWWGVPDYMIDSIRNFNPAGEYYDDNGNQQFYDGQTDNYWQNHYQILYSREITKNLFVNSALHLTTGKGYYEQYKYDDGLEDYGLSNYFMSTDSIILNEKTYFFPDSMISSTDLIRQKWLDNIYYGYTLAFNYNKNNTSISIGSAWNRYDGDHFGLIKWTKFNIGLPYEYEWYFNNGLKTSFSLFGKINYQLDKFSIYSDILYRSINYKLKGPDDDLVLLDQENNYHFINPKAGIYYSQNNRNKYYFSFGVANREPSRADLKDAVKDGETKPPVHETLYDYEWGYYFNSSRIALNINIYYMDYKNQLVLTGELNNVGYPIMTNVDKSYRRGMETSLKLNLLKSIELEANLTLSQNKIDDYIETAVNYNENWEEELITKNLGTTNISYSPELVGASRLTYKPLNGLTFNLINKYVGKQYIDNTSSEERKLDPYFINDFRIDYSFKPKYTNELNLQLLVVNLFNTKYINNAYGGNWYEQGTEYSWIYYYPQAGIHCMLKMQVKF